MLLSLRTPWITTFVTDAVTIEQLLAQPVGDQGRVCTRQRGVEDNKRVRIDPICRPRGTASDGHDYFVRPDLLGRGSVLRNTRHDNTVRAGVSK